MLQLLHSLQLLQLLPLLELLQIPFRSKLSYPRDVRSELAVGTGSVRIDRSGPFDEDAHVLPLAVELRFVADDDVVVHGLGDFVDGELDARILHGPHEARTGPARIAAAVRLTDDQLTLVRDFRIPPRTDNYWDNQQVAIGLSLCALKMINYIDRVIVYYNWLPARIMAFYPVW